MEQQEIHKLIVDQAQRAKAAARILRTLPTEAKNHALQVMAEALIIHVPEILAANQEDLDIVAAHHPQATASFASRLTLTTEKIQSIAGSIHAIAALPDPVGEIIKMTRRPNGLRVGKIRTPIGVICAIYESRPNVTPDVAALCLKSGNSCILRGGKEALQTNITIAKVLTQAAYRAGVPADFLQMVTIPDHGAVEELARLDQYIDLIIPRGGEGLIDAVRSAARMPVLAHRKGVTHIYVEKSANLDKAVSIIHNAKVSNPSVCNSLEKALVDADIAAQVIPELVKKLQGSGVEVRGCSRTVALAPGVIAAQEADWSTEYLDYIITVKVVSGMDEALAHIQRYSTGLADGIVTEDYSRAWQFLTAIDSAASFVNASTRFTDGGEFGLGAEIGINTSKLHGMGPMGLEELTVTKYIVLGDGQIRL